jgi:hypothetical protein
LGMMERALDLARSGNSNYKKGRDRKIALWGQPQEKSVRPIWKITKAKKVCRHGSSGRESS